MPDCDDGARLVNYLDTAYSIRVAATDPQELMIRRFDPKSRILGLDDFATSETRAFQMVFQIGAIEPTDAIDLTIARANFPSV